MSLAVVFARASLGVTAPLVTVEAHLANGLPAFNIVGLPETTVKEARDRVRSALLNSGFEFPAKRITVNLAPADLPKEGGRFDLPIAIAILAASGQIPDPALEHTEFLGELALTGELRAIRGALPAVLSARDNRRRLIVPAANGPEAGLITPSSALLAPHLLAITAWLHGQGDLTGPPAATQREQTTELDIGDVIGQESGKRASGNRRRRRTQPVVAGTARYRQKYAGQPLADPVTPHDRRRSTGSGRHPLHQWSGTGTG